MDRTPSSIGALVAVVAAIVGLQFAIDPSATAFQTQKPHLSFEVASIKARDPQVPLGLVGLERTPGRLTSRCASLKSLLFYAYSLTLSSPIERLPSWGDAPCISGNASDTYEIQAMMPPDTTDAQAREMMQTLLADRFRLIVHWETRNLPIFSLVVAPGGFKLKLSDPKDDPPGFVQCPPDDPGCRSLGGGSGPISGLAGLLSLNVGRPVVDKTGLTGTYLLDLRWASNSPSSSLPSLPTALKETFGLELKPDTGPVQVLVIDQAEKPSAN
jgi:uncharacterized protein (TIGR03435 family)